MSRAGTDLVAAMMAALKWPAYERPWAQECAGYLQAGLVYRRHPKVNRWVARDAAGLVVGQTLAPKDIDRLLVAGVAEACGSLAEPRDAVRLAASWRVEA